MVLASFRVGVIGLFLVVGGVLWSISSSIERMVWLRCLCCGEYGACIVGFWIRCEVMVSGSIISSIEFKC